MEYNNCAMQISLPNIVKSTPFGIKNVLLSSHCTSESTITLVKILKLLLDNIIAF